MMKPGKLTTVVIAAFSLLLVFGALLTALAETGFTASEPTQDQALDSDPTATLIMLPTQEIPPTDVPAATQEEPTEVVKVQDTATPEVTKLPTDTIESTETVEPTSTTSAGLSGGTCTKPSGWKDYKVKSGDTLYAISVVFRTDVATLKSGNCLTSNQIITNQILWVPDNATRVPTETAKPKDPTKTPKPVNDSCYTLTLSHLGNGADAVASPASSDGCAAGKYKKGEKITLTAAPDPGWEVGSWYGTDNNSSTALTNTLTMPASDQLSKPVYVQSCFALTISSGANGLDPVPNIAKSSGCTAGNYVSGEKITFTAKPNSGYTVDKWTGTDDDSLTSLTNTLKMPAAASAVSVTYKLLPPPCFALTLGVTAGSGSVPTASASTMGCAAGKYAAGEVITVTAAPTGGGAVDSWQITPVQSPTTTGDPNVIEVTMPASALTVKVTYNP